MDFQKLLFLYCLEAERTPTYEFVPYKYGGFSFTSYEDKRRLTGQGLLEDEERSWCLTPTGKTVAATATDSRQQMEYFARSYAGLRGNELVMEAYRRHPYYAVRSEIVERVLVDDGPALEAIAAARPATAKFALYTIGYEGRSIEGYLNMLIRNGVTLLCDVRRNPLSRKYGFSKRTLSRGCEGIGVRYEHLPELGIPSEDRRGLQTQADYQRLFAIYEGEHLPRQTKTLSNIQDWVTRGEHVALTCYERSAEQCHRHCIAAAMEKKYGQAFIPRHL